MCLRSAGAAQPHDLTEGHTEQSVPQASVDNDSWWQLVRACAAGTRQRGSWANAPGHHTPTDLFSLHL